VRGTDQIGELLRVGARRAPDHVAIKLRDGPARTYAQLDARTDRLANALLGLGLEPGDRVAAWMEDCVEYLELYFAVAKAGLVLAPINARFKGAEARFQLEDAGARALFHTQGLAEQVGDLLDPGEARALHVVAGGEPFEELIRRGAARRLPAPDEHALFLLGYTSGTTGRPKGAMLTHRSVRALARSNAIAYRLVLRSVGIFAGSLSFVATVPAFVMSHLCVGGTIVLVGRADVDTLLDTIEREHGNYTSVPSPRLVEFAERAARRPASWRSLESMLHGASKAPVAHVERVVEVVGDRYIEGWGMTENSGGLLTATTRADIRGDTSALDVLASTGQAVMDAVVDVWDEEGRPLPHDGRTAGELVAQAPTLMQGYWNRPRETSAALIDGWYRTGDIGTIDPAGYVYVSDRRSDLIVSGGMNVYPSEVEACILQLPAVADCTVFGAPHQRWGQTVTAAVVRVPGAALSAEEVIAHCRSSLAGFKKPTAVHFLSELPRTTSGKVRRDATRARVLGHA
jgi:acyl-CoA synthetase (AMP-forming)/AMP-acid ligase II